MPLGLLQAFWNGDLSLLGEKATVLLPKCKLGGEAELTGVRHARQNAMSCGRNDHCIPNSSADQSRCIPPTPSAPPGEPTGRKLKTTPRWPKRTASRSLGRVDDQLQCGIIVGLETCMLEAHYALLGMIDNFPAAVGGTDVVHLPP